MRDKSLVGVGCCKSLGAGGDIQNNVSRGWDDVWF